MKRRLALLVASTAVIAGCSSTGTIDGPVLTSPAQLFGPSGGMAAEVTGVLRFDVSTDCLLIESEGVQYPLVWPAGTRWQENPAAVVLEDGEKVKPGMTVYGGGGYLYRDHVGELSGLVVAEAAARSRSSTLSQRWTSQPTSADQQFSNRTASPPRSTEQNRHI